MDEMKGEHFKKYSKYFFPIVIVIISILIRIPKTPYIYGYDGFEVIWMAFAIKNGALVSSQTWLIHPLSYFGFYPFSQYPIGLSLLLSGLLSLNFSLPISICIIDFLLTIICTLGAYKLAGLIFKKEIYKNLFLIMIVIGNKDFFNYTNFSLHPRGVSIALSFWLIYYLLKFKNKKKLFTSLKLLLVFVLMILSYRIAWLYLFYLIPFSAYIALSSTKMKFFAEKYLNNQIVNAFFFLLTISMIVVGFIIIPSYDISLWSPISKDIGIFSQIATLGMIYLTSLGIMLVFLPVGLYFVFFSSKEIQLEKRVFLLFAIIFAALVWKIPVYSIVLFSPIYTWICILGIKKSVEFLRKKGHSNKFSFLLYSSIILSLTIIIHIIYISVVIKVKYTYFVVLGIIGVCVLFYILRRFIFHIKRMHWVSMLIFTLITSNVLLLQTTYEGQENYASLLTAPFSLDFSQNHITKDELLVIDYIKGEGIEGIILTDSTTLSRRIGGVGFLPTIPGYHTELPLYYGWVDANLVRNNTYFDFHYFLETFSFLYNDTSYEDYLLSQIRDLNVSRTSTIVTLVSLHIQYIVAIKNIEDNTIYPYLFHPYGNTSYYFFESLNGLVPSFNTTFLAVWKIY
ncbi:MAG: hypothetical protein KAU62_16570 [Candidatus Heimdallarchaeota archaeon]|nr:hypothetical protein [Candidatus Heimdallarchaeota archaeon]MCK4612771.1 hypothetical protein [Candidatus Heimdallarchaeota archaeon]